MYMYITSPTYRKTRLDESSEFWAPQTESSNETTLRETEVDFGEVKDPSCKALLLEALVEGC